MAWYDYTAEEYAQYYASEAQNNAKTNEDRIKDLENKIGQLSIVLSNVWEKTHMYKLRVKLDEGAFEPERAYAWDAGMDLRSPVDVNILPGTREIIDTGVHVEIPKGCVGLLTSKSGLMAKCGVLNTGTIDAGYTGPLRAVLFNFGEDILEVRRGMKITQLVILPVMAPAPEIVRSLGFTERGDKGFGSTGR